MSLEGYVCSEVEADDGCFMIDKVFQDEPSVYPEDMVVDDDVKVSLQKNVMLYFPNATIVEKDYKEVEESGERVKDVGPDEEGQTTVVPRWKKKVDKGKMGDSFRDDRLYREVVASPKPKWVAKADIMQDQRRAGKSKAKYHQVSESKKCYRGNANHSSQNDMNFITDWNMSNLHLFDDLVVLFFLIEYYYNNDLRLGKVNFFDAMCILIKQKSGCDDVKRGEW